MPTTISLSVICFRYSAWPGVLGWMTRRTPGSTMRSAPSAPSRECSSVMRRTSSASSGMRWRAASTMRWAIEVALSTDSDVPETVSVSPRSATRAPVCRASSVRLESFTPDSVSGSAPSTLMRCVIVSSGIRFFQRGDVQLGQVGRRDVHRRPFEKGACRGCLGKGDHVTE